MQNFLLIFAADCHVCFGKSSGWVFRISTYASGKWRNRAKKRSGRSVFLSGSFLHTSVTLHVTENKRLRFHFSSPRTVVNVKNEISANDLGQELTFWHFVTSRKVPELTFLRTLFPLRYWSVLYIFIINIDPFYGQVSIWYVYQNISGFAFQIHRLYLIFIGAVNTSSFGLKETTTATGNYLMNGFPVMRYSTCLLYTSPSPRDHG